jgi:hypothetical protein
MTVCMSICHQCPQSTCVVTYEQQHNITTTKTLHHNKQMANKKDTKTQPKAAAPAAPAAKAAPAAAKTTAAPAANKKK